MFDYVNDLALFFTTIDGEISDIIDEIVDYINSEMPEYTGNLGQSWYKEEVPGGFEIRTTAEYFVPLEAGREPGKKLAPIDPITEWVAEVIRPAGNPKRVAYAIIKKWGRDGRDGPNILGLSGRQGTLVESSKGDIFSQIEELLDNTLGEARFS